MGNIYKLFAIVTAIVFVVTSCHKVDDLPYYEKGTVVTLTANKTTVVPTLADTTNQVVAFSWTSPKYATDTSTYKFILEIDSTGRNFSKKLTKTVYGNLGTGLTGRELNNILLNYGFDLGVSYELDVRVSSSYTNNNEKYFSNVVRISATPFSDPSKLTTSETSVTCALATASQFSNRFDWVASFQGYNGTVNYILQYDSAGKNFAVPQEIPIGNSILTRSMTQGEMNETALNSGIPGGNTGQVEYRIKATTSQGAVSFSNVVFVTIESYVPILRFYMPGSYQVAGGFGSGDWSPTTAPELIRDLRSSVFNDMYYIYIYLPAGAQFKFTQGRSWDVNYGGTGGNLALNSPDNLSVATAGVYRITINRTTLKYDIRLGRMGFVGGATGAGWNPPGVFPNYALGAPSTNLFVGLTDLATDAWKLIDNDQWNNGSNAVDETRSYGSGGASGSIMEVNGPNFPNITIAGRYRAIWDGRDVDNIKYELSPATEMRVVGDGIQGVPTWNPGASPQMTYNGNGVWTITTTLVADKDIKFLAGNDWGAFDYEDNSGGSQATGTPRKIKWEGGNNFKTPTVTGIYTITLNENTQTVTIN